MPNYRRAFVPGGSFFFTLVTHRRRPLFANAGARRLLGSVFRRVLLRYPFKLDAIVLLPDHLHAIWSLPSGDSAYSRRWAWVKKEFTVHWRAAGGREAEVSAARARERRAGVWQPRFWEHTLEDEDDYQNHFDYTHHNPVKHGLVQCVHDWPWSTYHNWVERRVYDPRWGCVCQGGQPVTLPDMEQTTGETT